MVTQNETVTIEDLLLKINAHNKRTKYYKKLTVDIDKIKRAYTMAECYHRDQPPRASGEPYITHPVAVANLVADAYFTTNAICGALLHDTIEDTGCTEADIALEFGPRIKQIVYMLTRNRGKLKISVGQIVDEALQADDHEVLNIKLFDRVHNLQTIHYLPQDRQERIAKETIEHIYIIALALGYNTLMNELYNFCMRICNRTRPSSIQPIFSYLLNSGKFLQIPRYFL